MSKSNEQIHMKTQGKDLKRQLNISEVPSKDGCKVQRFVTKS